MLLDDIKKDMKPTTNDDVELLKSRIDNIEITMEKQNKRINDMEATIKHCIYESVCKCVTLCLSFCVTMCVCVYVFK